MRLRWSKPSPMPSNPKIYEPSRIVLDFACMPKLKRQILPYPKCHHLLNRQYLNKSYDHHFDTRFDQSQLAFAYVHD
jgi:hypothetical protein